MPLQAPKNSIKRDPAPAGTHLARCYQLIQIGTVQEEYMGKPTMMNKIRLSFELPSEMKKFKEDEPEKPIAVHKEYTFSMGPKANLRKLVEGIIGTTLKDDEAYAFDVEGLVGMACILNVKHVTSAKGNVRAEIASAAPLMKGMICPPQINPTNVLTYNSWSDEKFQKLPDFLKEKLMLSQEFKNKLTPEEKAKVVALRTAEDEMNEFVETKDNSDISPDDIPF